ncbi:MAG: helix-turn-helix transcriptional regulator [Flavobacteriaceae bacterium]
MEYIDISNRIIEFIGHLKISMSQFAENIDIPRSSLSHLQSGRNKPSLDLVLKISAYYPELSMDWLLYGKGNMLNNTEVQVQPSSAPSIDAHSIQKELALETKKEDPQPEIVDKPSDIVIETKPQLGLDKSSKAMETEQIVIFYADGTYKSYSPKN